MLTKSLLRSMLEARYIRRPKAKPKRKGRVMFTMEQLKEKRTALTSLLRSRGVDHQGVGIIKSSTEEYLVVNITADLPRFKNLRIPSLFEDIKVKTEIVPPTKFIGRNI